jgi:hypothetical protein
MDHLPLDHLRMNETALAQGQMAQRRMWMPLMRGFLLGFIPAGVAGVLGPYSANARSTALQWLYLAVVLGLYVGGWVVAISVRQASCKQSSRVLTKGMMIGLVASVVIPLYALVGLVILVLLFGPAPA